MNQKYINTAVTKRKALSEKNGKNMPNNKNTELPKQKMDIINTKGTAHKWNQEVQQPNKRDGEYKPKDSIKTTERTGKNRIGFKKEV